MLTILYYYYKLVKAAGPRYLRGCHVVRVWHLNKVKLSEITVDKYIDRDLTKKEKR